MLAGVAAKSVGASGAVGAPVPFTTKLSIVVTVPECPDKKNPLLLKVPPDTVAEGVPLPFIYKLAPLVASTASLM